MGEKKKYRLVFYNPAVGKVVKIFDTKAEAEARVEHYKRKYGNFSGYRAPVIDRGE